MLWLGGRATTNFEGVDVVPLLATRVPLRGAIVVCYGAGGGAGDDQLCGVPLQGAFVVCYGWGG